MTAQISDSVVYKGRAYSIAGVNGLGLFDPVRHGVEPVGVCTACWRGYYCEYEIANRILSLSQINLWLSEKDAASTKRSKLSRLLRKDKVPMLFGKIPRRYTVHGERIVGGVHEPSASWESDDFILDGLQEQTAFTGGLLLGDEFISEMYAHMGFQPAYKFRVVREVVFDAGRLIEEYDRSAQMAEFREMLTDRPMEPSYKASLEEIERWVEQCFSLDYNHSGDFTIEFSIRRDQDDRFKI